MSHIPHSATQLPLTDPTPIFEHFRGNYGMELLVAAITEFRLFERLAEQPLSRATFRERLALEERPFNVLTTALRAMGLLAVDRDDLWRLTPLAQEHLLPGRPFFVGDYVGLAVASPGVQEMIARLKSNRPAGAEAEEGAAFIYKEGSRSQMETETSARFLTLALAGRAKNVAPHLAARSELDGVARLLDVGGGTGIYSIALLQRYPQLTAVVLDRPEVLKVAAEMGAHYGVSERLELLPGDMFTTPLPRDCQALLLSNILHDWDVRENLALVHRCAQALPPGGRLLIHDVFLNDALDGPLPVALYSAALFTLTEGRAYAASEYRAWLIAAGLRPRPIAPTLVHCGVLAGVK
jgi:predicted O-methyltransferase YrrM